MKTPTKTPILALALTAFLVSASALASNRASESSNRGGGGGGGEGGGAGCLYSYSIQKIGPTISYENATVTYHVFVRNLGDCKLRRIDVNDILPRDMTYDSATPVPTWTHHRRIHWENVEIEAGQYVDFVITARVDNHVGPERYLTNTACAFAPRVGTEVCDSETTFIRWHDVTEPATELN